MKLSGFDDDLILTKNNHLVIIMIEKSRKQITLSGGENIELG